MVAVFSPPRHTPFWHFVIHHSSRHIDSLIVFFHSFIATQYFISLSRSLTFSLSLKTSPLQSQIAMPPVVSHLPSLQLDKTPTTDCSWTVFPQSTWAVVDVPRLPILVSLGHNASFHLLIVVVPNDVVGFVPDEIHVMTAFVVS